MNLFQGMTDHEIVSSILGFLLFNGYVVLLVIALSAFWVTSRPRRGRVRVAALWHIAAAFSIMWAFVSTVWAAPVEKSFIDADQQPLEPFFQGVRFQKVVIGLAFAALGVLLMVVGAVRAGREKRAAAQQALRTEAPAGAGRS
jgi:hypothetical protein